jgi:5'-3' exonuclease
MWFRAFHGVPDSVVAPDRSPVNAVRGFLDHVSRLVTRHRPTQLVACLDADWRPAFRVALLPSYKAHRVNEATGTDTPDALAPQVAVILQVLEALGIAAVGAPGYEADDVIGALAAQATSDVLVVTGDRDLFQVVRPGVRVVYTVKRDEVLDEAAICARYGLPSAASYADFALLRGDASDGLPGVPGIGEKTAAALVTRFGDVAGMLAALDAGDPTPALGKLDRARDYVAAAGPVVRVATDLRFPDLQTEAPRTPVDPERLLALSQRWGLTSSVSRLVQALSGAAA